MKILAGKFKGKTIEARPNRSLRPTKSFIRESMFNILRHGKFLYEDDFYTDDKPSLVEGRMVLDIFCGSGALGFEAVSRGAKGCVFIDQDSEALSFVRKNATMLGIKEDCRFIRSDSTQLPSGHGICELVFIDPPYNTHLARKALRSLDQQGWLAQGAIVVVEQGLKDNTKAPETMVMLSDRTHDKTRITLYQYRPDLVASPRRRLPPALK